MIEKDPNCRFCRPQESNFPHFEEYGIKERIDLFPVAQTDNVIVIPNILPVDPEGIHLLGILSPHCFSSAACSDLSVEVGRVILLAKEVVNEPLVYLEHGGTNNRSNSHLSVVHAHFHLCPARSRAVLII